MYPIGGQIHRWLADTYGDWRVALIYKEIEPARQLRGRYSCDLWPVAGSAERGISARHAADLLPLGRMASLPWECWGGRSPGSRLSRRSFLIPLEKHRGEIAYVSPATGYLSVYRKGVDGGRARKVVTAGRSAELEAFHPFDSRMDASRTGYLLFTARYGDRDALVVWDLKRGKVAGRYQFDRLVSILSPMWMRDGTSIVFSGLSESGVSDLYRVHLPKGKLEPLTRDHYQDLDPSPAPDGRRLVFASDRTADGLEGAVNLFVLDLVTGRHYSAYPGALGR